MTAPETVIQLPVADAVELTELLQFIDDWLATCHDQLREPLARFVGHPAYDISQLRGDLQRLAFRLGADNEDQLFGQIVRSARLQRTGLKRLFQYRSAGISWPPQARLITRRDKRNGEVRYGSTKRSLQYCSSQFAACDRLIASACGRTML